MTEDISQHFDYLENIYERAIEEPNQSVLDERLIKCPDCDHIILMIPTLHAMNSAIEDHIDYHRNETQKYSFDRSQTAMKIRLSLSLQVLEYASRPDVL